MYHKFDVTGNFFLYSAFLEQLNITYVYWSFSPGPIAGPAQVGGAVLAIFCQMAG
jgi:hypothetical protein